MARTQQQWRPPTVRVSWLVPLFAVLLGGLAWKPGVWLGYLGFLLVNLVGVLRAMAAARASADEVVLGGLSARIGRDESVPFGVRGAAAWVGAGLQAAVAGALLVGAVVPDAPWAMLVDDPTWRGDAFRTMTTTSLWVVFVSMLPLPFLPGFEAWLSLLFANGGVVQAWFGKRAGAARGRMVVKASVGRTRERERDEADDDDDAEEPRPRRRKGRNAKPRELAQAVKLLEAQVEVTRFLRALEEETREEAKRAAKRARKP